MDGLVAIWDVGLRSEKEGNVVGEARERRKMWNGGTEREEGWLFLIPRDLK